MKYIFILKDETVAIDILNAVIDNDNACFCPFNPEGCQIIRELINSSEKFISLRPGMASFVVVQGINQYIAYTLDEFKANLIWEQNEYGRVSIDLRLGRIWKPTEIVTKCPDPVAFRIWKGAAQ